MRRMMNRDRQRPAKAAVERCPGFPGSLPTGLLLSLLLVYPPTGAQWPARAGGLWGEKRNPEIFVLYGIRKKRARELAAAPDSRGRSRGRRRATHRTPRTRPQPAYPIPRTAYPRPPNPPTLDLGPDHHHPQPAYPKTATSRPRPANPAPTNRPTNQPLLPWAYIWI